MLKDNTVYRCPHCNKCIAISYERDECISVAFHKSKPIRRKHILQLLAQRRCAHVECKKDFIVECYAPVHDLLRWMIFKDPEYMAQEIFDKNPDLIKKLQQSPRFMALINNSNIDN